MVKSVFKQFDVFVIYSKSFHYEPRHYNAPHYRANSVTFPTGPPPPQVAAFDGVRPRRPLDPVSCGNCFVVRLILQVLESLY